MLRSTHGARSSISTVIGMRKNPSSITLMQAREKTRRVSIYEFRALNWMNPELWFLCRVGFYSVVDWNRRTTNASARNPIPNNTSAADSSVLGDCVNSDNWTLLSLITARAGRARIAEITARIEPTYNARTQILLAKIYSHERSHRWPYWLGTTTLVQAERTAPRGCTSLSERSWWTHSCK